MNRVLEISITPDVSVMNALKQLDKTALQILLVVDDDARLLGTITDGDVRRAVLHGVDLQAPVCEIMQRNPVTVTPSVPRDEVVALMRDRFVHCVPVVDDSGFVVGLESESRLLLEGVEDAWVVLMAGGLGMRLRPLTESVPKPLLKVNGKPMLEHILENLAEQGFRHFFLSVNYKAEMIKDYFGDGSGFGVHVTYLEEDKPLGTGGALSLLPKDEAPDNIIVMNGDLLTSLNFRQFLDYHRSHCGIATMAVRDYSIKVPYGVVRVEGDRFVDIVEKPAHSYFVNAGIYVLSKKVVSSLPENEHVDIPDVFEDLASRGENILVFPVREHWRDVGSHEDYKMAQQEGWGYD